MVSVKQEGNHPESSLASITQCLPYLGHSDPGSMMLSSPFAGGWTRWDSGRWNELSRVTINSQRLDLNSGLLTSYLWSFHCPPAASWVPFLDHSSQTSWLPAIWWGNRFSMDWLIEVGCSLWFISPGHTLALHFLLQRHRSEAFWLCINSPCDCGWIISLSGFQFPHYKISVLNLSGSQIC